MTKNNPHIGSSFEDFLAEEKLLTETKDATISQRVNEFWKGLQGLRSSLWSEQIISFQPNSLFPINSLLIAMLNKSSLLWFVDILFAKMLDRVKSIWNIWN